MSPIFFPFTYLPPGSADILRACFLRMTVLRPGPGSMPADMEQMAASGWLDVRAPLGIDADRLQAVIKGYRSWAELNRGSRGIDRGPFQSVGKQSPLFDETAPSSIRDAIRKQGRGGAGEEDPSHLFPDLVFLSMAEQFDIQTRAVTENFEGLARKEADLFDQLKGEDNGIRWPIAGQHSRGAGAFEEYMLAERLAAWCRLLAASFTRIEMPAVAVTTSRSAVENLNEGFAALKEVARMEKIAVCDPVEEEGQQWRNQLADYLQKLACGAEAGTPPYPPDCAHAYCRVFSMILYAAAGIGLWDLLAAAPGENPPQTTRTVVLLIQEATTGPS